MMTKDDVLLDLSIERDLLSGLYRREVIFSKLDHLLKDCNVNKPAIVLLEIHRFKNINDGVGPEIGDRLIQAIAKRLVRAAPEDAIIGRMGGDGYAVILKSALEVDETAAHLFEMAQRPFSLGGNVVVIDLSIGIAIGDIHGSSANELIRAADIALHHSSKTARKLNIFDPGMLLEAESTHLLENDLRFALTLEKPELLSAQESSQFKIHYQPQVSVNEGITTGVEALIRWYHPKRGIIGPDEFIPLVEDIAAIDLLGAWILQKACKDVQSIRQNKAFKDLTLSVNVSPKQLENMNAFVSVIDTALQDSGLPAKALILEITENTVINAEKLDLEKITARGCSLSLDDFGTGYSSMNVLRTLPFKSAKLDKVFVSELFEEDTSVHERGCQMIIAFQSLCDALDIKTTIEGVETKQQAKYLRQLGCGCLQGYFFSRPLSFQQLLNYLKH